MRKQQLTLASLVVTTLCSWSCFLSYHGGGTTTAFTVVGTPGSKAALSSSMRSSGSSSSSSNNNGGHTPTKTALWMSETAAAEEQEQQAHKVVAGFTVEEMTTIRNVYDGEEDNDSDSDNDSSIEARVLQALPTWNPRLSFKIKNFNSIVALGGIDDIDRDDEENINMIVTVSQTVNLVLDKRLNESKELLKELLDAGEIRKLDSIIGGAAREGKLDVAFFNVLTMNIQDAAAHQKEDDVGAAPVVLGGSATTNKEEEKTTNTEEEADEAEDTSESTGASRVQILQHIYTRCQEEVEKTIPPGTALLNKLLRTDNQDIRYNQLEHYLCPQKNVIKTPEGKELILNAGKAPTILVPPQLLVEALGNAVKQIRNVEAAGGTDRASAASMVESCRAVAKEARLVVGNKYGTSSEELQQFEQGLQPVFRPPSADSVYIKGE